MNMKYHLNSTTLCSSFIKDYVDHQRNMMVVLEQECCDLVQKIKTCRNGMNVIFSNSEEYISDEKIDLWKKQNQTTINLLKKRPPKKFEKISIYPSYKESWDQFFLLLKSLSQRQKSHNDNVIAFRIAEAKKVIGNINGFCLDDQQLQCIVSDAHNQLVIAGAGTGKTTTIVGKVKYLLKKGMYKPNEILVLSFTNRTVEDMSKQLEANIGVSIDVCTFHSLGYDKVLAKHEGKRAVYDGKNLYRFISEQLQKEMGNISYLSILCDYLLYNKEKSKSIDCFKNLEEYDQYIKDNPPKTIDGISVKSYGEMDIANFLWQNQIAYEYEKPYKFSTATENYRQYQPDFYLPQYNIYIEYFGINRQKRVADFFIGKNGKNACQTYLDGIAWKSKIHREHNTKLVECFAFEKFEGNLLDCLKQKLANQGVEFKPRSAKEIWEILKSVYERNMMLERISLLFRSMLNKAKTNGLSIENLYEKNRLVRNRLERICNNDLLHLFEPIYRAYVDMLLMTNQIDFSDMINRAINYIKNGKYNNPYKIVIVDEYQDMSRSRYNLLKALRETSDYKLFCVGDDWQSIYRFDGSDVNYILEFEKYWGQTEKRKIETTYRFPKRLIEVSSRFIMKNSAQISKRLKTPLNDDNYVLGEELRKWRLLELPRDSKVFFLGRYKDDEKIVKNLLKDLVVKNNDGVYKCFGREDLSISFLTIHASKGLQADYVFILNTKNGRYGFPSKIEDAPIMKLFAENSERYPFAEERRLFYVAMTRAKKKVIFVTPPKNENASCFFKEIREDYGMDLNNEIWICPRCGGRLKRQNGPFIGCVKCEFKRNVD